jgi:hypothetical protein
MCAHFFKRFRGLWTRCHFQFLGSGIHVKELQLILNPRRLKELRNGIGGSQEVESIYGRIDVPRARQARRRIRTRYEQPMLLHKFSDQSQSLLRSAGRFFLVADEGGQPN